MSIKRQTSQVHDLAEAITELGKDLLCPICLSFLTKPVHLECNHYFCEKCIEAHLAGQDRCPVCKTDNRKRCYVPAPQIESILMAYRTLSNTASTEMTLSQPISVERQTHVLLGNEVNELVESPTKQRVLEMIHSLSQTRKQHMEKDKMSFVWLVTGLTSQEKKLVNHVCTHSSVRIVNEYSVEVTHCIAATTVHRRQLLTRRTMKYCTAVLQHVPVLSVEWVREISGVVDAIMQVKRKQKDADGATFLLALEDFPSYEKYWVVGDEQVRHRVVGGPRRSFEQSGSLLFGGMRMEVHGEFKPPLPSREAIEDLIHRGGGVVEKKGSKREDVIVIVDKEREGGKKKAVTYYWLLDCISNYRIEEQTEYMCMF